MNATRFALKPIPQPQYRFSNVPAAQRDLRGSTVQCVTDREAWQACMGEMLLVCKEAIRRRRRRKCQPAAAAAAKSTEEEDDRKPAAAVPVAVATTAPVPAAAHGSKPLSLEYIADRLDVDDPMWGFVVRTLNEPQQQMLQGFITVTTFTNYNRTFRWDSLHPCSFQQEEGEGEGEDGHGRDDGDGSDKKDDDVYDMANRKVDSDGSLAREMNATVRAGDIWNEGIVWPRIAEIGLLGGLACGRTLVKLVIEQLEHLKPSARANYDYVVLQATDNSIPFYESLGFVRVGAVMQQENISSDSDDDDDANDSSYSSSNSDSDSDDNAAAVAAAQPLSSSDDSQQQPTALATPCALVSSKTMQYITTKPGETPTQIAKKLNVNVYDIIFLNQSLYPDIVPSSKTRVGTILLIPDEEPGVAPPPPESKDNEQKMQALQQQPQQPVWYIAKENETPRSIANKLGLNCVDLVNANKVRLQGLLSSSRLKDGTRVKISQFDSDTELYKPYAHWTFPDDKFEEGEPSYMMALKLNRSTGSSGRSNKMNKEQRPFASSLAVPVVDYQPSNKLLLATADNDPSPVESGVAASAEAAQPTTTARSGRAGRRRWQSHQDAESNSSNTSSTMTNDEDGDDDDVAQEKMPKPPLKPAFVEPYRLFCSDFKRNHADLLHKKHVGEASRVMGDAWRKLSPREKQAYDQRIALFKHEYDTAMQVHRETVARIRGAKEQRRLKKLGLLPAPANAAAAAAAVAPLPQPPPQPTIHLHPSINLFNKVVKLKPGSSAVTEGSLHLYEYWYVLTYIPDLQWCHLAPLYKIGRVFGENSNDNNNNKPSSSSAGRPIWKLVDEELGEEVDISSSLVIPVKAKSMKRTLDADKEEWDVIGTPLPLTAPLAPSRSNSLGSGFSSSSQVAVSRRGSFCDSTCDGSSVAATTRSSTAGTTSRKRKRGSLGSDVATPASSKQLPTFAMAVMPRTGKRVKVWIKISPGRGRPRGSKNKKPDRLVPNHIVTTGKKKPPASSSYNTNNSSSSNNNNINNDDNKNGRSSNLHSTRNNSRVKVVLPPTDVMASLEHASTPLKKKQTLTMNAKKPPAGPPVAELQNSHSAAMPAASCRTTRNSMASLAFSPLKHSTRPSAKASRRVVGSQISHSAAMPPASRDTRNSRAPLAVGETLGTLATEPASSPVRQSPRALAKSRPAAKSPHSHSAAAAALPSASRTTRFSRASLAADEGALAAKPASSPVKQSTRSSLKDGAVPQSSPSATMPSSRSTRISKASLPADETGGILAAIDQSDHVVDSQAAPVPTPERFPVGSVVLVQARSWPGYNRPGGVAHVTRVHQQGESILYDVKYVLGGREKDLDGVFLFWHDNNNSNTRPVSIGEATVAVDKQSSSTEKQPDSQISSQESAPPADDPPSSSLPLVDSPEINASAAFPVDAAVVVQGRLGPGSKYKPGGVARVTRVHRGNSILYDVKYVLGGNAKSIEESFLSWHSDNVVRPARSHEAVTGKKASTAELQQQESQTVPSQRFTQPAEDKSKTLVKFPGRPAAHSDEDAIASGGENNSQPERTSSRRQTKRIATLALLDDGTRGRGTPRSKSVRTRSMDILTEVAPYPNKRRRVDGSYLPSQASTRRARDPLELLMP